MNKEDIKYIYNRVSKRIKLFRKYRGLTQEELDLVEDTSQVLEWPDYVCYEIVKELVTLLLENAGDPRLQTNIPINKAIASPVQQQPQTK